MSEKKSAADAAQTKNQPAGRGTNQAAHSHSPQTDEFFHLLMEINIRMRSVAESLCKHWDITSVEGRLLAAIEDEQSEGLIQREVAERAHLKPSAVTRLISGLEERGLLSRADDPDNARQKRLFLTEHGRAIVTQFHQEISQKYRETLSVLTDQERKALLDMLGRVAVNLRKADSGKTVDGPENPAEN